MEDPAFYTKYDFITLMKQKRGKDYTYGWLEMAYAMPPLGEEAEMEVIRKEIPILQALPDFEVA